MSILKWFLIIALFFSTSLFAGVAKVALLKGEATLEREGKNIALKNGDTLEEKDSIKTSKDTQIQLIFEDKTVITLGSESDFQIQEYLNESTNQKAKFKFNQGAFKAITGKIGKSAPQNFTLETKTATIGIRGTIIKGKIDAAKGDTIFCEKGAISVRSISTGVTVTVPAGKITTVMPNTPPTPPRQVQPQDIVNLNQSMEPTPPPSAPQQESGSNTPANSGASQAAAPQSIDSTPPPPPPPAPFVPTAQTTTPTTATQALQTNLQTSTQDIVVEDIAQEIGVPVEDLQDQIQNQTCPSGTSGTYPNCIAQSCPANTVGIYPDCVALTCPSGTTGTYPDCVALTCPSGTTGTYPDCVALTCPSGTTGTYPDCVALTCPSGTTGTYPDCVALTCPSGTTGTYPDCVALTCPSGTTGTYPDCVAISTGGGTVVQTCPSGTTGTYPDCVALTCPSGTTGTYPNCVDIETTSLIGYATSLSADTNNTYVDNTQALDINISSDSTLSGSLVIKNKVVQGDAYSYALTGNTVNYSTKTFSATDSNGSGISMTTSTPLSQHVAWGEWTSIELDANLTSIATPHNYWAAGEKLIEAANFIANSTPAIYSYSGKVLGSTFDGTTYRAITPEDPTNKLFLSFDIGSEVALNSSRSFLTFTPTEDTLWDIRFVNGFYENSNIIISVEHTDSLNNYYYGYMGGLFYGENAQAIGGTFDFDRNETIKAYGVFAANQAPLSFSGLATSFYLENNTTLVYSINDLFSADINGTATQGSIALRYNDNSSRGTGTYDISGDIIAMDANETTSQKFAIYNYPSSDYVSWGYWVSSEIDGNATLMVGESFWVAGEETPESIITSLISNSATYIYNGSVLGNVWDGTNWYDISTTETNTFNASIEFGSSNPITVTQMAFTAGSYSVTTGALTTTTSAISGNTFSGNTTNTNTALDFRGKFFGPNANAIGGTWRGTFNNSALSGTGVFKATTQGAVIP